MESKTFALVDSMLWFVKISVATMLLVGAIAEKTNTHTTVQAAAKLKTQAPKVELVKKLQNRRDRRSNSANPVFSNIYP